MIKATIDHQQNELKFVYPAHMGISPVSIKINNQKQGLMLWRLRMRSYIADTLFKYANERHFDLSTEINAVQEMAIMQIKMSLIENYEGRDFSLFLTQVIKLSRYVTQLAPKEPSEALQHYRDVIVPLFEWIFKTLKK